MRACGWYPNALVYERWRMTAIGCQHSFVAMEIAAEHGKERFFCSSLTRRCVIQPANSLAAKAALPRVSMTKGRSPAKTPTGTNFPLLFVHGAGRRAVSHPDIKPDVRSGGWAELDISSPESRWKGYHSICCIAICVWLGILRKRMWRWLRWSWCRLRCYIRLTIVVHGSSGCSSGRNCLLRKYLLDLGNHSPVLPFLGCCF